jgi:hypothetical protein
MSGLMSSLKNTRDNIAMVGKGIFGKADNPDTNNNSKLFLGNLLFTTACAAALSKTSGDDANAGQSIAQDVIVNGNILLDSVNNPTNLFMQSIKETTIFAGLVGLALPTITEHFKSTPVDIACGVALPFVAEAVSQVGTKITNMMSSNQGTEKATVTEAEKTEEKATETETETEAEKAEKQNNFYKTLGAVGIAGILKAGVLGNNILQGNGHTSNAIYAASLFNTLKTGVDSYQSHNNNEKIRDSKDVIGILFDGVVSPLTTIAVIGLSDKLNLPNTTANTIAKAVVGGVIASGSLKGLTHLLNRGFDFMFKNGQTDKTE